MSERRPRSPNRSNDPRDHYPEDGEVSKPDKVAVMLAVLRDELAEARARRQQAIDEAQARHPTRAGDPPPAS